MSTDRPTEAARTVAGQRAYFLTGATRPVEFRIAHLRQLRALIAANESRIGAALAADFGKSPAEAFLTEFVVLYQELDDALRHLARWAARKRVGAGLLSWPSRGHVTPEPLGVTLVIGAWNYPVQLSLTPVVSALAAGNTVILKPSELAAATSRILADLINGHFAAEFFRVVEGGVAETTALLEQRFDKIFFTGSTKVGRIVAQAAARHLTPVTLELGGKSPAIVTADCNLDVAVRRLIWGKFLNAGQTCVAPDYVVVDRAIEAAFIAQAKREIAAARFDVGRGNYVQIIDERNTRRLVDLMGSGQVAIGGGHDVAGRTVAPTLLTGVAFHDPIMAEEIFGPILPVIAYSDLDAVLAELKTRPRPLALYLFSNDRRITERVLREIPFGGGCVNDTLMQLSSSRLPFGGVGESGMGSYHGEAGFRTFSHYKSVLERSWWPDVPLRYAPYTATKLKLIRWLTGCPKVADRSTDPDAARVP